MSRERSVPHRNSWIFCAAFLVCAFLIKPAQDYVDFRYSFPDQDPDLLYFSSPKVIKKMALSFDRVVADFYWMRTIQYYGRRDEADKRLIRYKNMWTLLDITTTLDPDLVDAYRNGAFFLADEQPLGAGEPLNGLKLLDRGIKVNPKEWRYYVDKGFIYYWHLKDYKKAGEMWRAGGRLPDAPFWMEPLAAMSLSKGGALDVARALWERQYRESTRKDVKQNALNRIASIDVARDIWSLDVLLEKYKAGNGSYPQTLEEAVRGKENKYKIIDPMGTPYQYTPATGAVTLREDSKVFYIPVPESYRQTLLIED